MYKRSRSEVFRIAETTTFLSRHAIQKIMQTFIVLYRKIVQSGRPRVAHSMKKKIVAIQKISGRSVPRPSSLREPP